MSDLTLPELCELASCSPDFRRRLPVQAARGDRLADPAVTARRHRRRLRPCEDHRSRLRRLATKDQGRAHRDGAIVTDRLRGVEQVGQPDQPTPIPADEAKPVSDMASEAAERIADKFIEQIVRPLIAERDELEAIVRRLATISVAGAYRVDQLVELREDARQWVAEHTDRGIDVVQAKEATDG